MLIDARLTLVRRWAVQWLTAGEPAVCDEILDPAYQIATSGSVIDGREAYVTATMGQLETFPGMGLTIHELMWSGDRLAVRFSEHGASARREDRVAAWGGVSLFATDGERLTRCWAEEDYLSRRRQLASGAPDPVDRPAASPWTTEPGAADPAAEDVVRRWLAGADLDGVALDDAWLGHPAPELLDDVSVELDMIFSAGPHVAFHGRQAGTYRGGLDGVDTAATGRAAAHHLAGIVTVTDGVVSGGHVVRDRLGLARSLRAG